MIDRSRDPDAVKAKKGTLPAFSPVPRLCRRQDGWTPERQQRFIEALADTGSVKAAAKAVNMAQEGVYLLRRHPEAPSFRKAWDAALKLGVQRLEDVAMDRALNGVEVPIYHFGQVVGHRRIYNDRLLMFLLRNRAAKRFAADSWQKTDAYTRGQLEKLRAQWQAEWEEEARIKAAAESEKVLDSINAKLDSMRNRRINAMPPRVREAWLALQDAKREAADENHRERLLLAGPDAADTVEYEHLSYAEEDEDDGF